MPDILRDGRKRGWFHIDNALLDRFGAEIGAYGVAVYAVLARHADAKGVCFPSYQGIADKLGVSRRQAIRTVGVLVERGLIRVQKRQTPGKRPQNVYVLTDDWCTGGTGIPSVLIASAGVSPMDGDGDAPVTGGPLTSDPPAPTPVTGMHPKETQGTKPMKQTHWGGNAPAPRATPLPDDFAVSDAMYAYAAAKGVGRAEAEAMTERFVLYWGATPKNALKTDWEKAWKSWLLGDLADGKLSPGGSHRTHSTSRSSRRPEGGNLDASNCPDATDHGPFSFAVRHHGDGVRGAVDAED